MTQAQRLLEARLKTGFLPEFPQPFPTSLAQAYEIQDTIIEAWPDAVRGWKVGRIPEPKASELGCNRLVGPIFSKRITPSQDNGVDMPVFAKGFAAVEGEFIAILGEDAPADKMNYTTEEATALIGAMHLGVEIASSPFPGVNEHGPLVTICDLGNNYGLIVGPEVEDWRQRPISSWELQTFIDGELVGAAAASNIPGGPIESVRYLLENTASRGCPLKRGDMVSTGAVTGVHQIGVGQSSRVVLGDEARISCRIVAEDIGD